MRTISILLTLVITTTGLLQAQKAKFKNVSCVVQKAKLPLHYSDIEERTYDLTTQGSYSTDIVPHAKKLYGWTVDQTSPNIKGVVNIYDFTMGSPKKTAEKKQKKDKEGKVTESWTEYYYTGSARGRGNLYVYGFDRPFIYESPRKKKSKVKAKQEAKKELLKKDLADNPFLASHDIADAGQSQPGAVHADADLPLVATINVDQPITVKTRAYRSASQAAQEYNEKQRPTLESFRNTFASSSYNSAVKKLNQLYGFSPVKHKIYLKRIKNEDHPDAKMWNDACQAVQTIFKTFRFNQSIKEHQKQLIPVVQFFSEQVDKIAENDKKNSKQRKAAYQNLLSILFYLDYHGEVIAWSEKHLDSKALDGTAKRMLARSDRYKAHLAFLKMTECHISSEDVMDEDDILLEVSEEEESVD